MGNDLKETIEEVRDLLDVTEDEFEVFTGRGFDIAGFGQTANVYSKGKYAIKVGIWDMDKEKRVEVKDGKMLERVRDQVRDKKSIPYVYYYEDHFTVMEYIEGVTWEDYSFSGKELEDLETVLEDIKDVVYELYKDGIKFGDLHGENIILEDGCTIKIIDWEMVTIREESEREVDHEKFLEYYGYIEEILEE